MVDFGKCMQEAKIGIIVISALGVIATLFGKLGFLLVGGLIGTLQFFVLNPIILIYLGFRSGKNGMSLGDSAITAALAGLVAGLVISIIGIFADAITGQALGLIVGIIGTIINIFMLTIGGLVCGAIGNLIASKF